MLLLTIPVLASPTLAMSTAFEMGAIIGITISTIVCTAIPLTTGMTRGNVTLGIVGALFTLPAAAFLGCIGGLPVACLFSVIISIVPPPKRPLLSQSEIEEEMRRLRGY